MENNKIGIITLYGNNNYGNKLQNFALQEFLTELDCNPYTLINYSDTNDLKSYIKSKIKKSNKNISTSSSRLDCFVNFNKKINYYDEVLTILNAKKISKKFDYFVVGSDQVWNNHYAMKDVELLKFVPKNKRMSYAASMGFYDLDDKKQKKIIKELQKFRLISVREEMAKKYLLNLKSDLSIEVNVDPVFLISKNKWDNVKNKPSISMPEKYVLTYFLGEIDKEKEEGIKEYANKNNCEIIDLSKGSKYFENSGPSEFIYLVENAKYIFTDSFHCIAFSIIYKKNFSVFDRIEKGITQNNNMNSRIDTLLNHFGLDKAKNSYNNSFDFGKTEVIINNDKETSKKVLLNVIGGNINNGKIK